jgi:ABC-type nitrate/sulfonate/bicarbonate transport system permease component
VGSSLALLALAVLAWQAVAAVARVPAWLFPSPADIARSLWIDRELLWSNAGVTLGETLVGFALAFVAGVGVAVVIRFSRVAERALWPLLVASQTVPVPAIAPALVIWLGFGLAPKAVVVALICFFPLTVNTVDGFRSVDPDLVNALRTLGASPWRLFREVEVPAALPYLFSGTKVAIAFSVIGAVLGEWVGASRGLGYELLRAESQFLTARLFAAIAVLSAMGIGLFAAASLLERWCLPWRRAAGTVGRLR